MEFKILLMMCFVALSTMPFAAEADSCSTEAGVYWYCEEGTSRWAYDCNIDNGDIIGVVTTMQQCASSCRLIPGCSRYVWSKYTHICYAKATTNTAYYLPHGGICGYIDTTLPPSCSNEGYLYWFCGEGTARWAVNCDFSGNDIFAVETTKEQCEEVCSQTVGCTRYVWSGLDSICHGKDTTNTAFYSQNGGICGYIDTTGVCASLVSSSSTPCKFKDLTAMITFNLKNYCQDYKLEALVPTPQCPTTCSCVKPPQIQ